MTHQTNEELRDQLDRKFNKYFEHYEDVEQSHIDKMVNEILSLIPQPEQLIYEDCMEVTLDYIENKQGQYEPTGRFTLDWPGENTTFDTEKQAEDWAKRHNFKIVKFGEFKNGKYSILKVVNESGEK